MDQTSRPGPRKQTKNGNLIQFSGKSRNMIMNKIKRKIEQMGQSYNFVLTSNFCPKH